MKEIRTTPSAQDASQFRWWPRPSDFAFICANALMPYLLAGILLAV